MIMLVVVLETSRYIFDGGVDPVIRYSEGMPYKLEPVLADPWCRFLLYTYLALRHLTDISIMVCKASALIWSASIYTHISVS